MSTPVCLNGAKMLTLMLLAETSPTSAMGFSDYGLIGVLLAIMFWMIKKVMSQQSIQDKEETHRRVSLLHALEGIQRELSALREQGHDNAKSWAVFQQIAQTYSEQSRTNMELYSKIINLMEHLNIKMEDVSRNIKDQGAKSSNELSAIIGPMLNQHQQPPTTAELRPNLPSVPSKRRSGSSS